MQAAQPDVARLQPTSDSLNVILKNTHFEDDILAIGSKIRFDIDYTKQLPVLTFKFPEPYYDFALVLSLKLFSASNPEWLSKNLVVIKLVISDPVITDKLSTLSFSLDPLESKNLRAKLNAQKEIPLSRILKMEEEIYLSLNKF